MYRATSFCEREKSSKRSVMKSERLLRAELGLVAVRATAADFAARPGFPSWRAWNVLGSPGEPRRRAAQAEPEHDRLRSPARVRGTLRTLSHPAPARPRRALERRQGAFSPLRPGLADLRGGPSRGLPAQPLQGLVGPLLASGHRARHRHPLVPVTRLLAPWSARAGESTREPGGAPRMRACTPRRPAR